MSSPSDYVKSVALQFFTPDEVIVARDVLWKEGDTSVLLTPTEMDYANIEREFLAIVFACERLHVYTFGRKVTIHTDHRPLESIIEKQIKENEIRKAHIYNLIKQYFQNIIQTYNNKVEKWQDLVDEVVQHEKQNKIKIKKNWKKIFKLITFNNCNK